MLIRRGYQLWEIDVGEGYSCTGKNPFGDDPALRGVKWEAHGKVGNQVKKCVFLAYIAIYVSLKSKPSKNINFMVTSLVIIIA